MENQSLESLLEQIEVQKAAFNEVGWRLAESEKELIRLRQQLEKLEKEKAQLAKSENRLKIALDGSGDGLWEFDFNTGNTYFSDTYKAMMGFASHEMDGKIEEWRQRIHPDDLAAVVALEEAYQAERITAHHIEYRLRCKDGQYKWVLDRGKIAAYSSNGKPALSVGTHTDINSRKQLQIQLQTTATRLSSLLINLPEAVLLEDESKKVVAVNQKFCDLFKIDTPPSQLFGRDSGIAIQQDQSFFKYPEAAVSRMNTLWEEKKLVAGEKIETAEGKVFEFSYIPIFSNAVFEGHLWVYQDITERLRNRKQVQEQRLFYEDILNNIPSDIVVLSPENKYLFINPRAVKDPEVRKWMLGISHMEYHAARPRLHALASIRQQHFEEALATKKSVSWEEEIAAPDGAVEYHIRNLFPVLDAGDEVKMVIAHGVNITHRKKSEQLIQLSEKRYRDMVNFSQAIIITHDLQGKILMVNPAGCDILGYEQYEIQGRKLQDLMAVMTQTGFRIRYLEPLLQDKRAEGVFVARHKDGSLVHLLYKNHLLEETGGEPYVISFSQNITHLIKAETELKMAKLLAENASNRTEAFLANMSHEIRTPMNGIMGIAALLKKTTLDTQQQRYLHHIQETANNLLVIVNDVLDLEKIVAGKLELESIPFSVEDKVSTVIETFRYKAEEKGLVLQWQNNLPPNFSVLGDPFRLGQILNNIIGNAMKFTNKGSITISASARKKNGSPVMVEYAVTDTGIGIAASQLQEVFNPFVQEKADVARKYGGTGLGLSICKNLVEMQGGNIAVQSEPGVGTTFKFSIPYLPGPDFPAEIVVAEKSRNFSSMKGIRVLVAEDVELNQYLARHILESWGAVVTVVSNGAMAVEEMQQSSHDIILMDIQMPVMNGMQATSVIRTLAAPAAAVPIVALTANALRGDSEKYLAAGMNSYLSKPFTEQELFMVMDNLLHRSDNTGGDNDNIINETAIASTTNNVEILYDLSAMEAIAGGNSAFINQLISMFINTAPAMLSNMHEAVLQQDWETLAKETHKLKPQVQSMGVTSLEKLLPAIEKSAKTLSSLEELPAMVTEASHILQRVIKQLLNAGGIGSGV